jgi:hypothetical protein
MAPATGHLCERALAAAGRRTGGQAGRDAADWWAQHTIGGRAPAHTASTAQQTLAALDAGDPAIYDTLPVPATGDGADAYDEAAPHTARSWHDLHPHARDIFDAAYTDAYTSAVNTRITRLCRSALAPTDIPGRRS